MLGPIGNIIVVGAQPLGQVCSHTDIEATLEIFQHIDPGHGNHWLRGRDLNPRPSGYVPKTEWDQKWRQWREKWIDSQTGKRPDPELIRQNAEAFEALAMRWFDSLTGKLAFPNRADLRTAVLYMILTYFDSANEPDLYFGDLMRAVEEKLRLDAIKHGGLKGLPEKKDLGQN
jgi:hypothetical protein